MPENAIYTTITLCHECYLEIPGSVVMENGALYMDKTCPVHGHSRNIMEKDAAFALMCRQPNVDNIVNQIYDDLGIIEVTDRCNATCKHCYHIPDNSIADLPAQQIIDKALSIPYLRVALMGAEPTVRKDLPEIIYGIRSGGKLPYLYTNGINLSDENLVIEYKNAGLTSISVSIHGDYYHDNDTIRDKQIRAVKNIVKHQIPFGQIAFTVDDLETSLDNALDNIDKLIEAGIHGETFCMRSSADIGRSPGGEEVFASDLFKAITLKANKRGAKFQVAPNMGSNMYHVATLYRGCVMQIIHWPNATNIDIKQQNMGPWAYFLPGGHGTFAHQAILRDGYKSGWFNGQRIAQDNKLIDLRKSKKSPKE